MMSLRSLKNQSSLTLLRRQSSTISSRATVQTPEFFTIIGVDDNWLQTPMEVLDKSGAFKSARRFATTAKTANNVAERAVKLATEYSNVLTKDGSFREWRTTGGTSLTTISQLNQ